MSWIGQGSERKCRRSVEGTLLVASSTSNTETANTPGGISPRSGTSAGRITFAKIHEPLDVPDLLALQTESFDRLIGNSR